MFIALLLSLLLAQAPAPSKAAPPKPQPTTPPKAAPAQPRPQAPRQATGAVSGMAITVTDGKGTPFAGVSVQLFGAVSNSGTTNAAGQLSFPGLRAGTYRLRFSGDDVVAFEREVTLKAGEIAKLPIALTAAEPPAPVAATPAPPPPTPAATPAVGPSGAPQIGSLSNLAERERRTKERREILLSCSGNTRNVLLVLTGEQPQRVYDSAEVTYYVVEGQGSAQVGGISSVINQGSFIAIPRGTPFAVAQKGNRPLTMLWTLSGEPCEQAR